MMPAWRGTEVSSRKLREQTSAFIGQYFRVWEFDLPQDSGEAGCLASGKLRETGAESISFFAQIGKGSPSKSNAVADTPQRKQASRTPNAARGSVAPSNIEAPTGT